jgi:hypothetical protein
VPIRLAGPQNSTSRVPKGKFPKKTVGDRTPEWEWKSIDSSGRGVRRSWWSDPLPRVWLPSKGVVFDVQDHTGWTGTRGLVHMGR